MRRRAEHETVTERAAVLSAPTFCRKAPKLIVIGASTGGTEAIRDVLCALPEHVPSIVIVQHMPANFTGAFACRLDAWARLKVIEAQGGERLQAGVAYLAPGHSHLRVKKNGQDYVLEVSREAAVNHHRPSVDVLFQSVAVAAGPCALGVILTGMGKDGAAGLLAMRQAGAWTIGQDEASSVVWGMPRAAAVIGALAETAPLCEIGERLLARLNIEW